MKIYVAHAIRGKTGTPEEIKKNLTMAIYLAEDLKAAGLCVPYKVEFYVPGVQDTFPQKALELGLLTIDDILAIDLAILGDCDALVEATWVESSGVRGEVKEAKRLAKPIVRLPKKPCLSDLVKAIGKIRKELGQ